MERSQEPLEEPSEESERKPTPRRRGTRGGRGRKKKTTEAPAAEEGATEEEPKEEKPKRKRAATRRRVLPSVRKEILISVDVGEQRVAVLEEGAPVEVYLERRGRRSIAGNVYKGVVDSVLPGMEASFVDIGLEKNGFLYVDEIVVPELEGKRQARRIQDLISRGQEVLVQAVKDPMGTKGARLTTEVSLPGRFVVYVPFGDGIGVSRRLEDAERERLKVICKELELSEGGIIVRTAAEGASQAELEGDLAFLRKLWATIQGRAARVDAPALVYQEAELPLRIVRDLFIRDFERVVVDHDRTYRRIVGYLKRMSPELAAKVELYAGAEPLMEHSGVDGAIRSTLNRRVDLPSGGYLIFDYAEALTVIDVNTGRFVGARGKGSTARLEDTITKNNLEAVKEIVRQLRLRDIGGIIVIDFIDMANPKNREEVEEALKLELGRDRTKTYVVEISPLGLVEMTRQNVTDGPREILTRRCAVCGGDGIVLSDETRAIDVERRLRRLSATSKAEAFLVELPPTVAAILTGPAGAHLRELEEETGKRFVLEVRDNADADHFAVVAEGTIAEIEPKDLPVTSGQELELTLKELDPVRRADAVGRVNGYVVSVAGGAKKVGRKTKVRIERATRTVAYASLVDGSTPPELPVEAGALADEEESAGAERARRSTRRGTRGGRGPAKKAAAVPVENGQPVDGEPAEPAVVASEAAEHTEDGPTADTASGDAAGAVDETPKRKTRRGSRGGRGRKKKVATSEPLQNGSTPSAEEEAGAVGAKAKPARARRKAPAAPKTEGTAAPKTDGKTGDPKDGDHAEATETDGSDEVRPRKRTRRGSRGGRGRRKPAVVSVESVAGQEGSG